MIPILYEKNETAFTSNGLGRLYDCISCVVTEERNGIYECDFDYPVNGSRFSDIQCGRIIGVVHDDSNDVQPFDIVSFSKPINGIVTFHAVHISYRLKGYVAYGNNINSLASALTALGTATPSIPFTFTADFTASGYASAFNGIPRSVRQLLGGVEGSILDTYGGEYEFDKFAVKLHAQRGQALNYTIRYGVNMVDYNEAVDFSEAYTSAVPYWAGSDGNGEPAVVRGNKVNSGLTPFNGVEQCAALDLTDKFEAMPTAGELENYALSMMVAKRVNLPKQTIKVDFVTLKDYGTYTNLLECKLCDSLEVIFPDYDQSAVFKIVRTEYDVITERYNNMELGELSTTLSQALGISEQQGGIASSGGGVVRYGVCSTAGATAAKTVTVTPSLSALTAGTVIYVKFSAANTIANPTLNVNGLGAKNIYRYGTTAPSTSAASSWNANSVVALIYDGNYWQMIGWINTTYSAMTVAEYEAGTSTTARLITPANLKSAINYHVGIVKGTYVYNGASTTTITFTDANVSGKSLIICGAQDAGNAPIRASLSGTTITVYLADPVTIMRINYICW